MSVRLVRVWSGGAALLLAVGALAGCHRAGTEPAAVAATSGYGVEPDVVALAADQLTGAGVTLATVREAMHSTQVSAPGVLSLDETRTARIGSLQEGLVLEIRAQVGDAVRAGQLLATMHGHAVHDAWAGYRKALAERRRAERALTFAADALSRVQRLYAARAVSLQDQQRAEVDQVAAREQLAMADAEVRRSIEELEHIGIAVDPKADVAPDQASEQIPVRTPSGGVVLERLVTPGTTVTPGTAMFVVSDLASLWAVAEVDEAHLPRLRVGRPVSVQVAAYPGELFAGSITFIGDTVNPTTRRVTVRAAIANRDRRLKPEMFATIALGESDPRAVVAVPKAAVQNVDGATVVFVQEREGRFRARPVTLGEEQGDEVAVQSGVNPGEQIAARGSFVLKSELIKLRSAGGA